MFDQIAFLGSPEENLSMFDEAFFVSVLENHAGGHDASYQHDVYGATFCPQFHACETVYVLGGV